MICPWCGVRVESDFEYVTVIEIKHGSTIKHTTEVNYHIKCNTDRMTKVFGDKL